MSARLPSFFTLYLIVLLSCVFPAAGISVSCSSGGGGETVSSSDTFDLDDSTSLQESISLDFGSISKSRDASGSGNNSLDEYISGTDYSLQNSVQSTGSFGLSSSASATAQSGSLAQDVAGTGSMSILLSSAQDSEQASQGASVTYGALDSVQAIAAGEGVYAAQSTGMAGLEGSILSGAVGSENVMGATGTFTGAGLLEANLAASTSAETGRASASGTADLDGTTLIDSSSFDAVSSQSLGMGLEGLRDVGDGYIGSFDVNVLNLEQQDTADDLTSQSAALQTAGGSASSYKLTGYKWHQNNPQIQLYLNTNNAPSGVTAANSQAAITAAADTWDDAVAQNIFADGTTVVIDNTKVVDNPLSSSPVSDGYNVHGWANLGNNYLGMCRWWSNGVVKDGYKSILEADIWYASDKAWTTDLSKATGSTFDLQSVAVHELGHTIGMGDIYPTSSDFAQVMNSYDGAQRVLGNGDLAGVQKLYGQTSNHLWHLFQTTPNGDWSSWEDLSVHRPLSTSIVGDPIIGSAADKRLEVFVQGSDGHLWHLFQITPNGDWSSWEDLSVHRPLSINVAGDIGIGSAADKRLEVFVQGSDGHLWHLFQITPNGDWSSWEDLSVHRPLSINVAGDIGIGSAADERLEVFVQGSDGHLWQLSQTVPNGDWSSWEDLSVHRPLSINVAGDIGIGSAADKRLEVFVQGSDGHLWQLSQTVPNGDWSSWEDLSAYRPICQLVAGDIGIGSAADKRLEVFVQGSDGHLLHLFQTTPNGDWSSWEDLSAYRHLSINVAGDIGIGSAADKRLEVFAQGSDGHLLHLFQTTPNGDWSSWEDLSAYRHLSTSVGGDPGIGCAADGRMEIFARGSS